jgi:phenylalanyl-tRNA synthetase alpha chain
MTDLQTLTTDLTTELSTCDSLDALERIRIHYLGKQGIITSQMKLLGGMPEEERKRFGAAVNEVKQAATSAIEAKKSALESEAINARLRSETIDITLPVREQKRGTIHPISQAIEEITAIFGSMGFTVAEGPNIEDDFHNFTALNIPANHPARQMHDTFYLPDDADGNKVVLRTHTSPVQIRTMETTKPPYRIIAPGRTYRCDSDMTHTPMFHQVEGLLIDKNITMAHLKGCITDFIRTFFENDNVPVRFRPSFFPFTEPSAEVDIGCSRENGELKIGAGKEWLEVLGCGMVHPNVLRNVGVDPDEYQGFAFGLGVERLAMLKYGIADLRTFFDADSRWLHHYGFSALDIPSLTGGLTQ